MINVTGQLKDYFPITNGLFLPTTVFIIDFFNN